MGKKIALLIGVSEYDHGLDPLPGATNDVDALERVLKNPEIGGFDIVVPLQNPLRQPMEEAIFKLFANREEDDLLLFYFSGHGIVDRATERFYLATRDIRKERGTLVKPSAVAANFLHENINDSRSQRQVIILDCCFSGAIAQGMTVKDDGVIDIQQQLGGKGRAILTSSTSTQHSYEVEGYGVYTRYLVEGIEKGAADRDGDGWISIDELHEYASLKVHEASPAMTPKFYPVEEGHKILIAKSPKDDPKLKYRKEVEKIAMEDDAEISFLSRYILDEQKNRWGLSDGDAIAIENEVLEPYRQRQQKLQRYEQALLQVVAFEFPISQKNIRGLQRLQEILNLRDRDLEDIEARIIAPKQTELEQIEQERREAERLREEKLKEEERKQQQEAERLQQEQELRKQQQEAERLRQEEKLKEEELRKRQREQAEYERQQAELRRKQEEAEKLRQAQLKQQASPVIQTIKTQQFDFQYAKLRLEETSGGFLGLGKKYIPKITYHSAKAEYFLEDLGNGVSIEMVAIPGGTFMMGSPEGEGSDREKPQHQVTIQPFFMGKYPITQKQWATVATFPKVNIDLNPDPAHFKGNNLPIECVSWNDAMEFCARLSQHCQKDNPNKNYRLPSEAEWEYACRGGTTTPFHFGETITTDLANYDGNYTYGNAPKGEYREKTTEVGKFPANAFGLHDMHGNVWEWCEDDWHENYNAAPSDGRAWVIDNDNQSKVLRGCSWNDYPNYCRSASRNVNFWAERVSIDFNFGFRVVCGVGRTS
ncbi:caspase, EACC1-associated type [Calothrix sp. 336/3]|uniref:caspase, EACC1-associated type n=1 Tax=Calothrix sp. 336/3 TaxID=1337936 RepID=UPI0004E3EBE1|nr:SUMF1/EgtB/PvdO family nonheme iron enzyme [Calothrix sp. 336/3]AKG20671.1 hypothetical protein IJ00_04535 [Calothrix sp. 336/3]